jgi:hypothetical protein
MGEAINKIYIGQTNIRIWVSTGADLTGATTTTIEVRQPTDTAVVWTATISNASDGSLYYDITSTSTLPIKGDYRLQPKVVFSDNTISYGTTTKLRVSGLFD